MVTHFTLDHSNTPQGPARGRVPLWRKHPLRWLPFRQQSWKIGKSIVMQWLRNMGIWYQLFLGSCLCYTLSIPKTRFGIRVNFLSTFIIAGQCSDWGFVKCRQYWASLSGMEIGWTGSEHAIIPQWLQMLQECHCIHHWASSCYLSGEYWFSPGVHPLRGPFSSFRYLYCTWGVFRWGSQRPFAFCHYLLKSLPLCHKTWRLDWSFEGFTPLSASD